MKKTSFFDAVHYFGSSLILCNNISCDDDDYLEGVSSLYADDEDAEIYQTFLTDCTDEQVLYLSRRFGLHFAYHSQLGLWVLLVTHYGTPWKSVECPDFGETVKEV